MSRYFLHLRDGHDEILDPDGIEFPTIEALRQGLLESARDLICGDVRQGQIDFRYRVDAEDEDGNVVCSQSFRDAVKIIGQ